MLHRMTEVEIAIRKINHLRMISVYEFTGATRRIDDGYENISPTEAGAPAGCMAITVFYGDNEQLTLTEMDPYFSELSDCLFSLYARSDRKNDILMDASTRKLFETGRYTEENTFQKIYAGRKGERLPWISFDSARTGMLLPLAEYLFTEICEFLECRETVSERLYGWHGNGMLVTLLGKEQREHPLRTTSSGEGEYSMTIGDFPKQGENMKVDVFFKNAQIDIAFSAEKTDLVGSFVYTFTQEDMKVEANVFLEGKPVCYTTQHYSSVKTAEDLSEQERKLLPEEIVPKVLYQLPWNMIFVEADTITTQGDIVKTDFCSCYLFLQAQYSETFFWTRVLNTSTKVVLRMNSAKMRRLGMKNGIVQTYFADNLPGTSGLYKMKLAGLYFLSGKGEEEVPAADAVSK